MSQNPRESVSLWMGKNPAVGTGKLKSNIQADVCVIGAGIAGLTTAYLLAKEGKKVVLIERGTIGSGESCRTTAHLSNAIDDRYYEIERYHGENGAKLAAESHTAAIDTIEHICRLEKIDCEFERVDGYLFTPENQSLALLDKELNAIHRAGLNSVSYCKHLPVGSLTQKPGLHFPNQAQFHPMKYLSGLSKAFIKAGGRLYTKTTMTEIKNGTPAKVRVKGGHHILADFVVVATNTPLNDRFVIHTKQAAYRTYVLGFNIPKNSVPKSLYWDTCDPYHYVRVQSGKENDTLIIGGEDHRTGQSDFEEECYRRLDTWAHEHFKDLGKPSYQWSGQIEETMDGLAFIGQNPTDAENIFIATGDSGMGMTHGTIAGLLLRDLILNRKNPWEKLYNPSRLAGVALGEWIKENANTVVQYADYLKKGEMKSADELMLGEGAILSNGLEKQAVYRSENGELRSLSAVCPHLGGVVRWNNAEKTWDCPCHGSRFSAEGKVIQGPAISDLERITLPFKKTG